MRNGRFGDGALVAIAIAVLTALGGAAGAAASQPMEVVIHENTTFAPNHQPPVGAFTAEGPRVAQAARLRSPGVVQPRRHTADPRSQLCLRGGRHADRARRAAYRDDRLFGPADRRRHLADRCRHRCAGGCGGKRFGVGLELRLRSGRCRLRRVRLRDGHDEGVDPLTSGRVLLGLAVCAGVLASSAAASSFPLQVTVTGAQPEPTPCPLNAAADANCTRLQGKGRSRGLGAYQASAVVVRTPRASGGFDSTVTGSLSTSRGALSFTGDNSGDPAGKLTYAIALSGSAGYASVTGTGSLVYSGIIAGNGTFLVIASLDPATAFDLSAPILTLGGVVARSLGGGRYAVRRCTTTPRTGTQARSSSASPHPA